MQVSGVLKLFFFKQQNPFFQKILLGNLIRKNEKDGMAIYEEGWGTWDPDGLVPGLAAFKPVLLKPDCTVKPLGL